MKEEKKKKKDEEEEGEEKKENNEKEKNKKKKKKKEDEEEKVDKTKKKLGNMNLADVIDDVVYVKSVTSYLLELAKTSTWIFQQSNHRTDQSHGTTRRRDISVWMIYVSLGGRIAFISDNLQLNMSFLSECFNKACFAQAKEDQSNANFLLTEYIQLFFRRVFGE